MSPCRRREDPGSCEPWSQRPVYDGVEVASRRARRRVALSRCIARMLASTGVVHVCRL